MAKMFKKRKKGRSVLFNNQKSRPPKTDTKDLMDPILYNGNLDQEKYPNLSLESQTEDKPEEEIENPLNKRREF